MGQDTLHLPDVIGVSVGTEIKTPARRDNIVQELQRPFTELLSLTFTLRLGLCFSVGPFSFCLDALGLFLQTASAVRGDLTAHVLPLPET